MITAKQLTAAGIPVAEGDAIAALHAEAALDWMLANTTLQFNKADAAAITALPACAKLFVVRFGEIMDQKPGVTSESIEGMSQSFDASKDAVSSIWAQAKVLLSGHLKSQVHVTPARRRW